MSKKQAGFDRVDGFSGFDPRKAAQVTHRVVMVSAKNLTAVAYIDSLSDTGKQWAQNLSLAVDDESTLYNSRMLLWNGTPYLAMDDFEQCLSLLDTYNEFEVKHVAAGLRTLINRHPKYTFTFSLAREYSVAVYFRELHYNLLDEIELANLGRMLRADEAGYAASGDHRLWWD